VRSLLGSFGGQENLYLQGNDIPYTHLGCFYTSGRAGGGGRAFIRCQTNQIFSQLGKWCQLDLLGLGIAALDIGDGSLHVKFYIPAATAYIHALHTFLWVQGGGNRWMALDDFG